MRLPFDEFSFGAVRAERAVLIAAEPGRASALWIDPGPTFVLEQAQGPMGIVAGLPDQSHPAVVGSADPFEDRPPVELSVDKLTEA